MVKLHRETLTPSYPVASFKFGKDLGFIYAPIIPIVLAYPQEASPPCRYEKVRWRSSACFMSLAKAMKLCSKVTSIKGTPIHYMVKDKPVEQ